MNEQTQGNVTEIGTHRRGDTDSASEERIPSMLKQPDQAFLDSVATMGQTFEDLRAEAKVINESRKALIARVEEKGIHKQAFRDAGKYVRMSPEQQENYDLSYQLVRRALGKPVQMELELAQAERTH